MGNEVAGDVLAEHLEALVRGVGRLEAHAIAGGERAGQQLDQICGSATDGDRPDAAGGLHLPLGLLAVATVGDHHHLVVEHHAPPVRPGEPRDPAQVGEVGDDHRVETAGDAGKSSTKCVGAPVDPQRGQLVVIDVHDQPCNFRATAWTASSYPWMPRPTIVPVATGDTTLVCRHGSRAFGFEMCTSTTGPSNAASASCRLHA